MSADREAREHYTQLAQRYFDWLNREYERIDHKINSGVGGAYERGMRDGFDFAQAELRRYFDVHYKD